MKKIILTTFSLIIFVGCGNPFKRIDENDIVDISLKIKNTETKEEKLYQFERMYFEMILYELKHSRKISYSECIKASDPMKFHLFLKTKTKEYKMEITNDRDFFWMKTEDKPPIPFRYERLRDVLDKYKKEKED